MKLKGSVVFLLLLIVFDSYLLTGHESLERECQPVQDERPLCVLQRRRHRRIPFAACERCSVLFV